MKQNSSKDIHFYQLFSFQYYVFSNQDPLKAHLFEPLFSFLPFSLLFPSLSSIHIPISFLTISRSHSTTKQHFQITHFKKQIYLINQAHKTLFSILLIKMRKIKAIAKRQQQSIQIRQLNVSVLNLPLYCTNTIPIVQSKANHSSLLCAILQIQVILVIKCCWKHVIAEHISIQLLKISIRFHFEST